MNTGHGTARAPAQRPTSEAEIKIDETRVDGAAAVRLLYQWSAWAEFYVGRVAAIKPEFCGFNFNPV